jgi:hypothetical protein
MKLVLDYVPTKDAGFLDAKIEALSCIGFLAYSLRQQDPGNARLPELMAQARQLWKDADAVAPENSRLLWVVGPMDWNIPPEHRGGQAKAMEVYEKGLVAIRNHKPTASDPLEPSRGEPELLMNLAWSNLHRTTPDIKAAEVHALEALELVPYWHYVRDILMRKFKKPKMPWRKVKKTKRD